MEQELKTLRALLEKWHKRTTLNSALMTSPATKSYGGWYKFCLILTCMDSVLLRLYMDADCHVNSVNSVSSLHCVENMLSTSASGHPVKVARLAGG